jgi:hypothetical protein
VFWGYRLYRARTLFELEKDLRKELEFLNEKALAHQKNYQIWHHRQLMMEKLMDPSGEHEFIAKMFEKDDKNYHVWSYRYAYLTTTHHTSLITRSLVLKGNANREAFMGIGNG